MDGLQRDGYGPLDSPPDQKKSQLDKAQLTLLQEVDARIKTGNEFMGSQWSNCEAEVIACQALGSCALNQRELRDAFSWQGTGTQRSGNGGNNPRGMQLLLDDGMIVVEPRDDGDDDVTPVMVPKDTVRNKHGIPMVIRVTPKLIYYAASKVCK